jgi:starch synthase
MRHWPIVGGIDQRAGPQPFDAFVEACMVQIYRQEPRILFVTPEITRLPEGWGKSASQIVARAGGLGDIAAALIDALYRKGADVHVAVPNYRNLFAQDLNITGNPQSKRPFEALGRHRIHLAQDRSFFYRPRLDYAPSAENIRMAMAFQREVMSWIIPRLQPDLVHCHDWMTALIPAICRKAGIPCLFTLYNVSSTRLTLAAIEDYGIDAAAFWQHCYYDRWPVNYPETRDSNPLDCLTTAVYAADVVTLASPGFFEDLIGAKRDFAAPRLQFELQNKFRAGSLNAIAHAPDPSFHPAADRTLFRRYSAPSHAAGKRANKQHLQDILQLRQNPRAPLLFWPTRLDCARQGCWLMADILPRLLDRYADTELQLVFVADGNFLHHLRLIVDALGASRRVALRGFDAKLQRLAYAAADFVLMPMRYEPCGLPCKIALRYGALPIAHHTGGIRDVLALLDPDTDRGNGFPFDRFDDQSLWRAIEQAMQFYSLGAQSRARQIQRIMTDSKRLWDHAATTTAYIDLYERILKRPLTSPKTQAEDLPAESEQQVA